MSKAQSFGFDILLTVIIILLFGQLFYLYSIQDDDSLLFQRRVENNQILYNSLNYNNSISLFNSYTCSNNLNSLEKFNNSINHFLNTYVTNREYLLVVNDLIYSSEGVSNVCLKKASPVVYEIISSCDTNIKFEFSVYSQSEKTSC